MIEQRMREAEMRRCRLVEKIHLQRARFATQLKPLGHALESADAAARIVHRIGRHPEWLAAAAAVLILLTPRRLSAVLRVVTQGLRSWRQR